MAGNDGIGSVSTVVPSDSREGRVEVPGGYHPALDGLRGFALTWAVGYHLWPDVVKGGWAGVSLFFTLSGFLVVGLLDSELRVLGRIRLGRFFERRARRILPAALVTIIVVVAATALVDEQSLRDVAQDALAAALNVFNWRSAAEPIGYAAIFDDNPAPIDHFWSLSIEEQFYIAIPFAIAWTRRPVLIVSLLSVLGLAGVALWWGSPDAYVASPVRALEIAAGAILALAIIRAPDTVKRLVWLTPLAVIATIYAVGFVGTTDDIIYRGGPQLMALAWPVLLVATMRGGPLASTMGIAPLRWLGTRSYGIYLYHWPLIELTDLNAFGVIAVTLALAEISHRLIEMPIRRGIFVKRAIPVLLAGTATVALGATATAAAAPTPPLDLLQHLTRCSAFSEVPDWYDSIPTASSDGEGDSITERPPLVTVVGESTGLLLACGLRDWSNETRSMAVVDRTVIACSPVIKADLQWRILRTDGGDDPAVNRVRYREPCRVDDIEPGSAIVLVVDHGSVLLDHRLARGGWVSILGEPLSADVELSYRELVDRADEAGARVAFTTAGRWLPRRDRSADQPQTDRRRADAYNEIVTSLAAELPSAEVIDLAAVLDASGYDGIYGRNDGVHVDVSATVPLAADVLGPALLEIINP